MINLCVCVCLFVCFFLSVRGSYYCVTSKHFFIQISLVFLPFDKNGIVFQNEQYFNFYSPGVSNYKPGIFDNYLYIESIKL